MITRKELEELARLKGLTAGNTEKDYLLDLVLSSIGKHSKNELVFKGGTCLAKFHKLARFSEDLDFSAVRPFDVNQLIERIIADLKKFDISAWQHQKKEPFNSILIVLRVKGPLFINKPLSYARVGLDINLKSSVLRPAEVLTYRSLYPEVPPLTMLCMVQEEIFAEKIRALLTRKKARDLYDLYFLVQEGISASRELIEKKMEYYEEAFAAAKLLARLPEFASSWEEEMKGLLAEIPPFDQVRAVVQDRVKRLYL